MGSSARNENPAGPAISAAVETTSTRSDRRKVAIASFSGTAIEFYDFQIYGTAAALVFPHVLFPALGTAAGAVASIATFGVAFVARPFGGVLFGHLGDRLGRKRTLVATLMIMGTSTVLVGLVPTASQIGIAAPIIVILLRIVQGLAAGGEWAGAVLFASEHAPRHRRGIWAAVPQLGGNSATLMVNATFLATALLMTNGSFVSWGWRIPFLASAVLVLVGLYVRLTITETPVFQQELARGAVARIPFAEAVKHQSREILLATGASMTIFVFYYLWTVYLLGYAVTNLGLSRTYVLATGVFAGLLMIPITVTSGMLTDRLGRRTTIALANGAGAAWALAVFPIIGGIADHRVGFAIAIAGIAIVCGAHYGAMGSFVSELFPTRYRYTASGIAYTLASLVGGTVVPLVAPVVVAGLSTFAMGVVIALLCLVALLCTFGVRETRGSDLTAVEV